MMKKSAPAVLLVLLASGCGAFSTSPSGIASLSLDEAAVTIPRTMSVQMTATAVSRGGTSQDVTALAEWSSSNSQVVTVSGGQITAVGIGSAVVTARYEGLTGTVAVTARRRTRVSGEITVTDATGRATLSALEAYLDSTHVGAYGVSGTRASLTVSLGVATDSSVEPGRHEVSVIVVYVSGPPPRVTETTFASEATSRVVILDRDTSETVAVVPLVPQQVAVPGDARIAWSVEVGVYSS